MSQHTVGRSILAVLSLLDLVRGGIHFIAKDSGLVSIAQAPVDGPAGAVAVSLLANIGASQLAHGVLGLYVVSRKDLAERGVVKVMLASSALGATLSLVNMWLLKPLDVPGRRFNLVTLVVLVAGAAMA